MKTSTKQIRHKIKSPALILLIGFVMPVLADTRMLPSVPLALQRSNQLILVLTKNIDDLNGSMQRYQRNAVGQWESVDNRIPAVVGERGVAQSKDFQNPLFEGPLKYEGDQRTPMGVFSLGPLFGFGEHENIAKMNYRQINKTTVCIDDKNSPQYNQLIDRVLNTAKNWHSAEEMYDVPLYRLGGIIQYNTNPIVKGSGSCIFLHIWRSAKIGTAGCVAMPEAQMLPLLQWLDKNQRPVIAIFSYENYLKVRAAWHLPVATVINK